MLWVFYRYFALTGEDSYCIIMSSKFKVQEKKTLLQEDEESLILIKQLFSKEVHGSDLCGFGGMGDRFDLIKSPSKIANI
jgi:hypothetical protein